MRASLFIAPTVPVNADLTVDTRYFTVRQINALAPTFGGQFLIHGQPGAPIPGNASLTLHDGSVDWVWGALIAERPLLYKFLMNALYRRLDGTVVLSTIRDMENDAQFSVQLATNMPAHGWLGDGL